MNVEEYRCVRCNIKKRKIEWLKSTAIVDNVPKERLCEVDYVGAEKYHSAYASEYLDQYLTTPTLQLAINTRNLLAFTPGTVLWYILLSTIIFCGNIIVILDLEMQLCIIGSFIF